MFSLPCAYTLLFLNHSDWSRKFTPTLWQRMSTKQFHSITIYIYILYILYLFQLIKGWFHLLQIESRSNSWMFRQTDSYILYVNFNSKWAFNLRSIFSNKILRLRIFKPTKPRLIWWSLLPHTFICLGFIGSFFRMAFTKFAKRSA